MSDWQGVGDDPCRAEQLQASVNSCEAANFTDYNCVWNQKSFVSGSFCEECDPVCRSAEKSLNFVQFCCGIAIFVISAEISAVSINVMASNAAKARNQVIYLTFSLILHSFGDYHTIL